MTCRGDLGSSSVLIKHKYENFRGVLLDKESDDNEDDDRLARVMRIDEGDYVTVPWGQVAPLPDSVAKWRGFCQAVYLEGVLPAGGKQRNQCTKDLLSSWSGFFFEGFHHVWVADFDNLSSIFSFRICIFAKKIVECRHKKAEKFNTFLVSIHLF